MRGDTERRGEMAMRLEGETRTDLEQRVERLENTLKAVARESESISVRGPCQNCGQCLVFNRDSTMYCPYCGDGQNL